MDSHTFKSDVISFTKMWQAKTTSPGTNSIFDIGAGVKRGILIDSTTWKNKWTNKIYPKITVLSCHLIVMYRICRSVNQCDSSIHFSNLINQFNQLNHLLFGTMNRNKSSVKREKPRVSKRKDRWRCAYHEFLFVFSFVLKGNKYGNNLEEKEGIYLCILKKILRIEKRMDLL